MSPANLTTEALLLQLSASSGPEECCLAVCKALERLLKEGRALGVRIDLMEAVPGMQPGNLRSALVALEGPQAVELARRWEGTLQWTCTSPYRPGHGRKNWFIGARVFAWAASAAQTPLLDKDIRFEALRASGPGGQHVNKTDSAVRATHLPSGLSVKVQTERSQHANKRLARVWLACQLADAAQAEAGQQRAERRMHHHQLERGNPARSFRGEEFLPVE